MSNIIQKDKTSQQDILSDLDYVIIFVYKDKILKT